MPLYSPATVASIDGWLSDTSTMWTYVSSTSFKVAGTDVTAKFQKGTRLRLKQGGSFLYFVVTASSFSTDTTVTITGGSDYTLANASITDNYYSYQASPQGYPTTFNYTPTYTGFSVNPTGIVCKFSVLGNQVVFYHFGSLFSGTSNATTFTISVPIACLATSAFYGSAYIVNGGSRAADLGLVAINEDTNASTIDVFRDGTKLAWTASGNKMANFTFAYNF